MNEDIFNETTRSRFRTFGEEFKEATTTVERELNIEDKGWINLSYHGQNVTPAQRINNVILSRVYSTFDPLGAQTISIYTSYTFGASGVSWSVDEEKNKKTAAILSNFWNVRDNRPICGASGQRRSSDKLLVDGEIFFAIFPGNPYTIRRINPLEITEIITDPDDEERPLIYERTWMDRQGKAHVSYYRSTINLAGKAAPNSAGASKTPTEKAIVYHLTIRTLGQRGNPLLLPAIDWIKQYRRYLASRVGLSLARSRWAWKQKVIGGQSAVDAVKAVTNDQTPPEAGSTVIENQAVSTEPIQTPQDARNAYDDARLLKLQVCAAVGIPEQYFGDISIGNLATAKTVELPMLKQFQTYQAIWADAWADIFDVILEKNNVGPESRYVDRDFPTIAPEDAFTAAQAIVQVITAFPEFANIPDVQQQALLSIGVNDPAEALAGLDKEAKHSPNIMLARALREFQARLKDYGRESGILH